MKFKAVKGLEEAQWRFQPPGKSLTGSAEQQDSSAPPSSLPYDVSDQQAIFTKDGSVRFGTMRRTYKIPADNALQSRIRRTGMSLVPEYQKQLANGDPAKIPFRFYAFDAPKIRTEICSHEGTILVPLQMLDRLRSDDQLAAVLADGIAYNIERQAARLVADNRAVLGSGAAGDVVGAFVPGVGLAAWLGGAAVSYKIGRQMEEERSRVALGLMAAAGYDPNAAPETWRLLAPKKMPMDASQLKYPDRSGYQLAILYLGQIKARSGAAQSASAVSGRQ